MTKKQMAILQFDIDVALDSPILQMLDNLVLLIKKQKLISTMLIKNMHKRIELLNYNQMQTCKK
jgi:hypothetical protein